MTPGQIQGALKDLKPPVTQKQIAEELGCSANAVSIVINQRMVSDPIMRAVAAKLGKEPWDVFKYYRSTPRRGTSKTITPYKGRDRKAA